MNIAGSKERSEAIIQNNLMILNSINQEPKTPPKKQATKEEPKSSKTPDQEHPKSFQTPETIHQNAPIYIPEPIIIKIEDVKPENVPSIPEEALFKENVPTEDIYREDETEEKKPHFSNDYQNTQQELTQIPQEHRAIEPSERNQANENQPSFTNERNNSQKEEKTLNPSELVLQELNSIEQENTSKDSVIEQLNTALIVLDPVQRALMEINANETAPQSNPHNEQESSFQDNTGKSGSVLLEHINQEVKHVEREVKEQAEQEIEIQAVTPEEFAELVRSLKILILRIANSPMFNETNGSPAMLIESIKNNTNDPNIDLNSLKQTMLNYAFEKTPLKIVQYDTALPNVQYRAKIRIENASTKKRARNKNLTYIIRIEIVDNSGAIKGYWSETTREDTK